MRRFNLTYSCQHWALSLNIHMRVCAYASLYGKHGGDHPICISLILSGIKRTFMSVCFKFASSKPPLPYHFEVVVGPTLRPQPPRFQGLCSDLSSLPPGPLSQTCPSGGSQENTGTEAALPLPLPYWPGLKVIVALCLDTALCQRAWLGQGRQRTSLTAVFSLRVPVKEVLPGIIKQGVNCLESQGQNTAGDFLLGMGICRGSAKNPPPAQVSWERPRGQIWAWERSQGRWAAMGSGASLGSFILILSSYPPHSLLPRDLTVLLPRLPCPLCTTHLQREKGRQSPLLSWVAAL